MKAAVTLDVDSLRCYYEIHGLPDPAAAAEDPIYTRAVPRFFELLAEAGIPATLFLIGRDAPQHAAAFAPLAELRCEVGNHSFSHDYCLTQRTAEEIRADLAQAHEVLQPLGPLVGVRAPGYNTNAAFLRAAEGLGYRYDSSRLPSPPYFLARAAMVKLLRKNSRSQVGDWRAFAGPLRPYPLGGLRELPITCEPLTRLPLFGTNWPLLPPALASRLLAHTLRWLGYVNFEMHAIDLLDASDTGPTLARLQPGLRTPAAVKMRAFRALFRQLRDSAAVVTLEAL